MQRSNGASACASCKHQRKKCTNKCALAVFFPAERTREFKAVHKVFGVSNVTRIIMNLKEEERRAAVDSLVWEALCRQRDPVLGPYGEYRRMYEELSLYKSQYQQQCHQVPTQSEESMAATQGMIGWPSNSHKVTSNGFHGGPVIDFRPYGYYSNHSEKLRGEVGNSSALILPHKHLANSFNQHYIFTGT